MATGPKNLLTSESAWKKLQDFYDKTGSNMNMMDMFNSDPSRFDKFSVKLSTKDGEILLDYSKNHVNEEVMTLLFDLARERNLEGMKNMLFSGEKINWTEKKAALHHALRNRSNVPILFDGKDVMPDINKELFLMREFCEDIHSGKWKGYTSKKITDVVNIGIGGSNLGPFMVTEALQPYQCGPNVHFVSNVDGTHLVRTLRKLDPGTTLFIVASKSFTTQETLSNAISAKEWFLEHAEGSAEAFAKHFVSVTTNITKAIEFGISESNIFKFWDWVGGKFSLWSPIGLSIALFIGMDNYEDLLAGGHFMDQHFMNAPYEQNIPVILSMIGLWNVNFLNATSHAVLPYDQSLHRFVPFLQQVDMESNGKSVTRSGQSINYNTAPIIWGGPGADGQHSFMRLMNHGTHVVPCDFIIPVESHNPLRGHQEILAAHCFAQSEALLKGTTTSTARAESEAVKKLLDGSNNFLPHKLSPGNRPSNSIMLQKLTPFTLGILIAMYEHKVFVQGVMWDVNSFDQLGCALSKRLATLILPELKTYDQATNHDSSTNGLINFFKSHKKL